MKSVEAVQFVIILVLYVLRLLKSNVHKLVWHHGASVCWKIIIGSAEIERVRFAPGMRFAPPYSIWALCTETTAIKNTTFEYNRHMS